MTARHAEKILIPTDYSHESMAGLTVGIRRACESGATLLVMHVLETHWYDVNGVAYTIGTLTEENWVHARKELDDLCEVIRQTDLRVISILRHGAVAEEILKAVEDYQVDLILMSSGGETNRPVGKTTARVLEKASCEVWSVKGRLPARRVQASVRRAIPIPLAC
ncbi:MAG: universal stress protein [Planctomycetota bacterium]